MKTLGKYEVLEELGAGAMGKVFRGRDRVLHREVAIKTIAAEDADIELKQRFYREARACGKLSHPNIVTVHDLGEQQGSAYIAMEFLDGEDLRKLIDRKTFLPLEGKLPIMAEVCDGLGHAHDNRVVHRDIKPSNIFLLKSGRPKILDFGIARVWASQLTRAGFALGTPEYMAPEQIRGKEADARSDIFSAAVVFFELLTYVHPFAGSDIPRRIIQEQPLSLLSLNPLIPEKLEKILSRALAKDPDERFQTAAEFAKALRKVSFEVLTECDRAAQEGLQNREKILELVMVMDDFMTTREVQSRLAKAEINLGIVKELTPEMTRSTNANLHYFHIRAVCDEIKRTLAVLQDIHGQVEAVRLDVAKARGLVDRGSIAAAESLLKKAELYADHPELAALLKRIEETRSTDLSPVTFDEEPEEVVTPEVIRVRERLAALLAVDADRCLAEIEILSPALASDVVIGSYYARAMELRKAPRPTPAPVSGTVVSQRDQTAAPFAATAEQTVIAAASAAASVPGDPGRSEAAGQKTLVSPLNLILGTISVICLSGGIWYLSKGNATTPAAPVPGPAVSAAVAPAPLPLAKSESVPETALADDKSSSGTGITQESARRPAPAVHDWTREMQTASADFENGDYLAAVAICDRILRAQPNFKSAADLKNRAVNAKKLEDRLGGKP